MAIVLIATCGTCRNAAAVLEQPTIAQLSQAIGLQGCEVLRWADNGDCSFWLGSHEGNTWVPVRLLRPNNPATAAKSLAEFTAVKGGA